ncbi:hypothetical protein Y1Q_0014644 [Alligator mississippiensis]|uniref:Uncharacterized protein n=1 Tax=Alligator mississippiensis TaxID=8496 RepID=A0A151P7X0_ALLMI|nr:hypothetical protein Y1Q_0014644 [Alligator mississippiensis]
MRTALLTHGKPPVKFIGVSVKERRCSPIEISMAIYKEEGATFLIICIWAKCHAQNICAHQWICTRWCGTPSCPLLHLPDPLTNEKWLLETRR